MIAHMPVFVATTVVMLIMPGPDFVIVTRHAVAGRRRQAYSTAMGICGGLLFLTLVTASGLAAVVVANPGMMLFLRLVGGGYLLFLGGTLLWSARRQHRAPELGAPSTRGVRSPVVQGFLNNVLNPKALVFYLTFMPQFLVAGRPVYLQTMFMGVLVVVCAATWWTAYVTAISVLHAVLMRAAVRSAIDVGAGMALSCLGAVTLLGGL